MSVKIWAATAVIGVAAAGATLVQAERASAPAVEVPRGLEPYADVDGSLRNAIEALEFLKTARFRQNIDTWENDGKREPIDYGLEGECNTPENHSLNRGIHLALAGYYLFLAKQEVGWFEYKSPVGSPELPHRNFAGFGRGALIRLWRPELIEQMEKLIRTLETFPGHLRADLATFLEALRSHRTHVERVLDRAEGQLRELLRRSTSEYFYRYLLYENGAKGLTYEDLSHELYHLINNTRDPNSPLLSKCLIQASGYDLLLGDGPQITSEKLFYPMKYMTTFWLRRRAEGTVVLADYLLGLMIKGLR